MINCLFHIKINPFTQTSRPIENIYIYIYRLVTICFCRLHACAKNRNTPLHAFPREVKAKKAAGRSSPRNFSHVTTGNKEAVWELEQKMMSQEWNGP